MMQHLGDITKIDGAAIEPVWCVTGGSLFDGIGGFPLCWEDVHGTGTAIWASEIEEFPIAVTKKRFGGVKT